MYRKFFLILILFAVLLAGCEKSPEEITETSAEIKKSTAEITSAVTTSVTSETVIFCEESVFEETSAEITDTAENERSEFAKKAEEAPAVNVDFIIDERDIYNDLSETRVGYFYAEYPEISGADEAVCKKINDAVRSHIDEILWEEQEYVQNFGNVDDGKLENMYSFWINDLGRKEIRSVHCEINCNYGNLLSVYFNEYSYNIVLPEKHYVPYTMVFDLRTGEQVDFDEIISDREGFDGVFEKAFAEYGSYEKYESGRMYYPVYEGKCDYMLFDYVTVKNDCLGMYLAKPTARDSMPTEINEVCVPISDITQYLTVEGRELFEGFAPAEASL